MEKYGKMDEMDENAWVFFKGSDSDVTVPVKRFKSHHHRVVVKNTTNRGLARFRLSDQQAPC